MHAPGFWGESYVIFCSLLVWCTLLENKFTIVLGAAAKVGYPVSSGGSIRAVRSLTIQPVNRTATTMYPVAVPTSRAAVVSLCAGCTEAKCGDVVAALTFRVGVFPELLADVRDGHRVPVMFLIVVSVSGTFPCPRNPKTK